MKRPTYLRLSVTDACNQQCIYCRPAECSHTRSQPMSMGDIQAVVTALARVGVDKVRITGGEPLLREDLLDVIDAVSSTPGVRCVGLTTNAVLLTRCARELKQAGVSSINISLDSLNRQTYERITGTDALDDALDGLRSAVRCGFDAVKTNTVVMNGINDHEVTAIAALGRYLPVETRFIELMPLRGSSLDWQELFVPASCIRDMLGDFVSAVSVESSTAKTYRTPGARGRIGIIAPVSEPFCARCNRVRVTCSGLLKPCLRRPLVYDILQAVRSASPVDSTRSLLECAAIVKQQMAANPDCDELPLPSMSSIGGQPRAHGLCQRSIDQCRRCSADHSGDDSKDGPGHACAPPR